MSAMLPSFLSAEVCVCVCVCVLAAQSCLTLCDRMGCSPSDFSVHGDSPGKNTGVDCHALLQRIFPAQGLSLGLLHCKRTCYHLSHKGSLAEVLPSSKKKLSLTYILYKIQDLYQIYSFETC